MAVNYNSLKSLKGTAVGTIVPWAGNLTEIPKGWIKCDGSEINANDYPLLYSVIGNTYGGTSGSSFILPRINNNAIVDYHQNHQNISGISMPNIFKNQINNINDTPNTYSSTPSSNIDLHANLPTLNNLSANVSGQNFNNPGYSDAVFIAGRVLGDDHIASHSHQGSTFNTVSAPNQWVEDCQNSCYSNCFTLYPLGPCCKDDCTDYTYFAVEANWAARQSLRKGDREGGISLLKSVTGADTVDFARKNAPNRNYILSSEDPVSSNTGNYAYNTTLDQNAVNWVNSGSDYHSAHDHEAMNYDITIGSMKVPTSYNINTVGTGTAAPINDANKNIATIQANIETAVCNILHIIRAY